MFLKNKNKMELIFIKKQEVAKGTVTFFFEKPKEFDFLAGQFAKFTLDDSGNGLSRYFSFSSAPYEKHLSFTARIRRESDFKKNLLKLKKR